MLLSKYKARQIKDNLRAIHILLLNIYNDIPDNDNYTLKEWLSNAQYDLKEAIDTCDNYKV